MRSCVLDGRIPVVIRLEKNVAKILRFVRVLTEQRRWS